MSLLTEKLSSMRVFRSRTPATKEQILQAERQLELNFSKEFRNYLLELGCASIYGHEFTGLCTSSRLDVVQVTLLQRELNKHIPFNWYVIEDLNIDGITVWQDPDGNIYSKLPYSPPQKVANSFLEYIDDTDD